MGMELRPRLYPSATNIMEQQASVSRFYDHYGEDEWLRLEKDARARVILHLHKRALERFVRAGDRVLDAGCGPGRFSFELQRLGARVTAGDISPTQVSLVRQHIVSQTPAQKSPDLAVLTTTAIPFRDAAFDCVVCFGSVLSHLGEQAQAGMRELVRVTKKGGLLLISVMSTQNRYLPGILDAVTNQGIAAVDAHIREGVELPDASGIPWRTFGHEELEALAKSASCDIVSISASNVMATVADIPLLDQIEKNEALWQAFIGWEEHLSQLRGNTERGSHLIAVLRKQADASIV
jgi:ubiquinone/menaquinone biosynthesis C-methylase UbiE